jgi:hypothetical protein
MIMPNWTETRLKIKGSRDNCLNLLNRFVSIEQEGIFKINMPTSRYGIHLINYTRVQPEYKSPVYRQRFARSFTFKTAKEVFDEIVNNYNEINQEVEMLVHCAWSAEHCLIFGNFDIYLPTIMDMCKLYNVSIEVYSEEPGLEFTEEFNISNDGRVTIPDALHIPEICDLLNIDYEID